MKGGKITAEFQSLNPILVEDTQAFRSFGWSPCLLNPPLTSMTATLNFLPSGLLFSELSKLGDILSNSTERFVEFHEPI